MMWRLLPMALGALAGGAAVGTPGRPAAAQGVTFTRDVAPVFQRHCQECHYTFDDEKLR